MTTHDSNDPSYPPVRSRARWLWLALGHCAVGIGALGAFLPLLPTTPLLLLAAWAYARSSPALRARLYAHPQFGRSLRQWHEQGAIAARAKVLAVVALGASWALAVATTSHAAVPYIMGAVAVSVSAFILTRPRPVPDAEPDRRSHP
jgi:hypothetical protein